MLIRQQYTMILCPRLSTLLSLRLNLMCAENQREMLKKIAGNLVPVSENLGARWAHFGAQWSWVVCKRLIFNFFRSGAGRGGRTPTTLRSADFESAASASSAIPAWGGGPLQKVSHRPCRQRYALALNSLPAQPDRQVTRVCRQAVHLRFPAPLSTPTCQYSLIGPVRQWRQP